MQVEVLDGLGRVVTAQKNMQGAGPQTLAISTGTFAAGIYSVRLVHNGHVLHRKLVVGE